MIHLIHHWDLARLRYTQRRTPGLQVHPTASSNFASAEFDLAPGARLEIGEGAVTERLPGTLRFLLGEGAQVRVGRNVWLRTLIQPITIVAFPGAEIEIGPEAFLNGCYLSAKRSIWIGTRGSVGMGSRVFDADQHDLDDTRPEQVTPVRIEDHSWVAADVTVLRGVRIGPHSVVGTRSVVTRDVPPYTLVAGIPARPMGELGDRTNTR